MDRADIQYISEGVIEQMVESAERTLGLGFHPGILFGIVHHTIRKWEKTGYGEDYLPVLFENELRDYLMRREINAIGRMNYERNFQHA